MTTKYPMTSAGYSGDVILRARHVQNCDTGNEIAWVNLREKINSNL